MSRGMDIAVEGLWKAFGDKQVLCGFSGRFPAGSATALMGPSGSGKTTLVRILMGLERPDAGSIQGFDAARFCCVFQEDRLCEQLSAAENVALVLPRGDWEQIGGALRAVGLQAGEQQRPVAQLSGGERRRVALVRAVLAHGDALILDEAFKGLDEDGRGMAYGFVRENLRGRTLLVVTHEMQEAEAFGARVVRL